MSTRYDDTYRDREYESRGRRERPASARAAARDERETGGGLRRDVRETGQDIRSAGNDIVSSWCGLWSNLLISLGEVISPQSGGGGSARRGDPDEGGGGGRSGFSCGGGEFSVRCDTSEGRSEGRGGREREGYRGGRGRRDEGRDDRDDRDDRTTAHFSGGDTEIDVAT